MLCVLLVSCSFYVYSEEGIIFDPHGSFISTTGQATLSSYNLEDHDVSYQDILKLDVSSLFNKGTDMTNGIKGTVQDGGWIDLKAFVYDRNHDKHVVYHARLEEDSAKTFSVGTPQTEYIKINKSDNAATDPVAGTKIKILLGQVNNVYHIVKSDWDRMQRTAAVFDMVTPHNPQGSREKRGIWGFIRGALAGLAVGAVVGVGLVSMGVTGGLSTPVVVAATTAVVGVLGANVGLVVEHNSQKHQNSVPAKVSQLGSPKKVNLDKLPEDHKVIPSGSYPVNVVLEINNASFMGAKIPGIPELTPALFQVWNTYSSPQQLLQGLATNYWFDNPGVLNENDHEVSSPDNSTSKSFTPAELGDFAKAKLIVSGADGSNSYIFNPGSGLDSGTVPEAKMGDHITLEVAVPIVEGQTFDQSNPFHYPELKGFPFSWMAFFSGEALYQCEPSIQPGAWRPWLGYDSQVHGTTMRQYPPNFQTRFYDWHADTSIDNYVIFRWTAKFTRRMGSSSGGSGGKYHAVYSWPKKKSQPVSQRNNQKEGLNMELLRAWKDHTAATNDTPDFAAYDGNRIVPGLDPDEFLYLRDSHGNVTDIITLEGEPWKQVPADEAANPLNDIVTAYKKNRMWHVDNKDYRDYYEAQHASENYEIQDLGTGPSHPDGTGTGNNTAPGSFEIHLPQKIAKINSASNVIPIQVAVTAPLGTDKGFYGNISGPEHFALWERGLIYQISGLLTDPSEVENYAVSFIYEDALGHRKYLSFFSSELPDHMQKNITKNGEWYVAVPSMLGYGYYSVNLWYKNSGHTDSWTRIGGKELLDISLRFLSVPRGVKGVKNSDYSGIALKESPGDGAFIYLDDFRDEKQGNFSISKFHRYAKTYARTYVFNKGDTTTFEALDSDPHTFTHRGTEWYLSSRTQAKRVTDEQLNKDLMFYVDPIKSNGQVVEDNTVDGKGKKFTNTWNDAGIYQLKAVYRGTSWVAHRIVVVDSSAGQNDRKASVTAPRELTPKEKNWLTDDGVVFGTKRSYKLLSVTNLLSKYRYIDGPRMHSGNQVNRFHPGNDYADGYRWKVGSVGGAMSNYSINGSAAPAGLAGAFSDRDSWLPRSFVRHTSEKNSQGNPMPDDIANGSISVSRFSTLNSDAARKNRVIDLFNNAPEPWQVRLLWISFVMDPNPYGASDVYSYRTRTNIKVLYDMNAFFNNNNGAFSGKPDLSAYGDYSYERLKNSRIFLHLMSDNTKEKDEFYQNLATGRMIIYNGDSNSSAQASNAKGDGTVIAAYSPD